MKPVIIVVEGSEIKLTKEEFEKYIQQAYDNGVEDGKVIGRNNYIYPCYNRNTITTTPINTKPNIMYGSGSISSVGSTDGVITLTAENNSDRYNKGGVINCATTSADFKATISDEVHKEISNCISNVRTKSRGQL